MIMLPEPPAGPAVAREEGAAHPLRACVVRARACVCILQTDRRTGVDAYVTAVGGRRGRGALRM
eukprot:COSAG02_NODE_937_length_15789_cov_11.515360_10_plen_64_part_00